MYDVTKQTWKGKKSNSIQSSTFWVGQLSKMSLVSMSLQTLAQTLLLLSWNAVRVTQQQSFNARINGSCQGKKVGIHHHHCNTHQATKQHCLKLFYQQAAQVSSEEKESFTDACIERIFCLQAPLSSLWWFLTESLFLDTHKHIRKQNLLYLFFSFSIGAKLPLSIQI